MADDASPLDGYRQFFALSGDVFVLSVAMFAFSLGFQMTTRFLPEYLRVLGASGFVIGLFGTFGNLISALYPYPGGAISDRIGSRYALTVFGAASTLGFLLWFVAPSFGTVAIAGITIQPWLWVFVGLVLAQAWKSFGLGATFAIVKQSVPPERLARGFASTETFRRSAFLLGPVLAAGLLALHPDFTVSFRYVLGVAVGFGVVATAVQHWLYDAGDDSFGDSFEGLSQIRSDLQSLPATLRPLLVGDTLVRFANGMVYVFFIIVVTEFLDVGLSLSLPVVGSVDLAPATFFGLLLGVEMVVALLVMAPAAALAERVGLKLVVATGFAVYAIFPILLISAPANATVLAVLFAFSGLRFAGLPAHKALIVGPAEADAGGRVTGAYYLLRNLIVIPSGALGGALYGGLPNPLAAGQLFAGNPTLAFAVATVIGLLGTGYFLLFGEEFEAYV
ncbi:MFS transporter [Halonotius terrestris]|uniref:MFS transporter n=1 Tax=Halonotius terrestris TaxID=2487750 RepID=A0A8J8P992_9EURY|nr:MFS transporter [Halonotius terrestris]TQQ80940.1 MFS transporter [Halonotius terrestris]